jgi:hypothetical protein
VRTRDRDSRGWKIPKPETAAARVYEMMTVGASAGKISATLGKSANSIRVTMWRIRHPERANEIARNCPSYRT